MDILKLPSGRTLRRYKNAQVVESGWFDKDIKRMVAAMAAKGCKPAAMYGGLMFDEMKIKDGLVWSQATGELVGWSDIGERATDEDLSEFLDEKEVVNSKGAVATHMLQFMWTSVTEDFTYCLAYFLTDGVPAHDLYGMIMDGITRLGRQGLHVVFTVCDGAGENTAWSKMCKCADSKFKPSYISEDSDAYYFPNPVFPQEYVAILPDPPHVEKLIRNCCWSSFNDDMKNSDNEPMRKMCIKVKGEWKYITWRHWRATMEADVKRPTGARLCPRLNRDAIELSGWSKMRCALSTVAMEEATQNAMRDLFKDGEAAGSLAVAGISRQIHAIMDSNAPICLAGQVQPLLNAAKQVQQWVSDLKSDDRYKLTWNKHTLTPYLLDAIPKLAWGVDLIVRQLLHITKEKPALLGLGMYQTDSSVPEVVESSLFIANGGNQLHIRMYVCSCPSIASNLLLPPTDKIERDVWLFVTKSPLVYTSMPCIH
jgi:hypothetical protein